MACLVSFCAMEKLTGRHSSWFLILVVAVPPLSTLTAEVQRTSNFTDNCINNLSNDNFKNPLEHPPTLSSTSIRNNYFLMANPLKAKGPIFQKMLEIKAQLGQNESNNLPFSRLIPTHAIDFQALGQKPQTFLHLMLMAVAAPPTLSTQGIFPADVLQKTEDLYESLHARNIGGITHPNGIPLVRKHVAKFLTERDNVPSNADDIYLTNGVSGAISIAFKMLHLEKRESKVGVMMPIPVFPIHRSHVKENDLHEVPYHMNPRKDWALEMFELVRAYSEAMCSCNCTIRALFVVNPGNATGKMWERPLMENIIRFAYNRNLVLIVDEIYQDNVVVSVPFVSFRKVVMTMEAPFNLLELISTHSISKGDTAEEGLRGGYMEVLNVEPEITRHIPYNIVAALGASNVMGQVGLYSYVNPPKKGDPSYELFVKESKEVRTIQREAMQTLCEGLNNIMGISCNKTDTGVIVFPRLSFSEKAIQAAESMGIGPDLLFGLRLLEETGIVVAGGSAFGLKPDQHHIRITVPRDLSLVKQVLEGVEKAWTSFTKMYG